MNSTRNRVTLGHKNDRKSGNAPWSRNSQVKNLLADENRRKEMCKALHSLVKSDSAQRICDMVEELA